MTATWRWAVIALLLGIQGDVAPLEHPVPYAHSFYSLLSVVAWVVALVEAFRGDRIGRRGVSVSVRVDRGDGA